jgi:DNA (cytosine-5)-methyltransferase 1
MGFPDNYTLVNGWTDTTRYQAIGNSWAVPVVKWIGSRIYEQLKSSNLKEPTTWIKSTKKIKNNLNAELYLLENVIRINEAQYLNSSQAPNNPTEGNLRDILETDVPEKFYLSPQACKGILRRKEERDLGMNKELERLFNSISLLGQTKAA